MKKQQMSVRDIQRVSIDILSVVDEFCCAKGINYSLGYGALIGAIRHKGCIPWDDDIDIIMTRPEYNRFIKIFNEDDRIKEKGLKLFAPELGNCYHPISRVCDMKRSEVYKYYQWTDEQTGVWIDIFVIEPLPDGRNENLVKIASKTMKACRGKVIFSKDLGSSKNIKNVVKHLIFGLYNRERCIREYLNEINKNSWDLTETVGNFVSPYSKDMFEKSIFDSYIRIPFESREVSVISTYDQYLKIIYGDYMQLPPKEKQVRGHSANFFWWR